jgi:hypothetical protein
MKKRREILWKDKGGAALLTVGEEGIFEKLTLELRRS